LLALTSEHNQQRFKRSPIPKKATTSQDHFEKTKNDQGDQAPLPDSDLNRKESQLRQVSTFGGFRYKKKKK
jgi:hypothetical protein